MYPPETAQKWIAEEGRISAELLRIQLRFVAVGEPCPNAGARQYLLQGCGRRILTIRHALRSVYRIFPPSRATKLTQGELADTQINVHAFMMNLYGFFENCAWVLWHLNGLAAHVKNRREVTLFNPKLQRHFPDKLRTYLAHPEMQRWHVEYLKSYRDALAHRIPVYLPPSEMTKEVGERYQALDLEKIARLKAMDLDGFARAESAQAELGTPCPFFLHSFSEEDPSKLVYLHPQLLSDALTLVDFSDVFLSCLEPSSTSAAPVHGMNAPPPGSRSTCNIPPKLA